MVFQPKIGEILLNKYETISPIGDGAFGSVWRARDIKLDRIVAVKFINTSSGVLSRFSDELEAIKNLDHPNIVRLYDFDILRGGVPCIVMELVNGREIGDILMSDGPFTCQRLCNIILQVVDALVETHKHNIVHCDLKPENIMLMNVGARDDVVKLIDFGVASIMSKDTPDPDKNKMIVGTPQYMAPEQIRRGELGPWTDIYALGLIMIELFTGQFVFDHEDPHEVLRMQLNNPVNIPHDLASSPLGPIIARAVEKDSSKRYQSTQEFYEDLRSANRMLQSMVTEQPTKSRFASMMFDQMGLSEINDYDDEVDDFLGDLADFDSMMHGDGPSKSVPALGRVGSRSNGDSNVPLLNAASISTANMKAVPSSKQVPLMENSPKGKTTGSGRVLESPQKKEAEVANLHLDDLQNACASMGSKSLGASSKSPSGADKKANESDVATVDNFMRDSSMAMQFGVLNEPKPSSKSVKPSSADSGSRSIVKPVVIFVVVLLIIGGIGYALTSGLLEEKGIVAPKAEVTDPVVEAPVEVTPTPDKVSYATIRTTATQMAYVSAISGHVGTSSRSFKKVMPYRVFGTPIHADILVNDSLVCVQSPCNLHVFGDPTKVKIGIRDGAKTKSMVIGKHDPFKPIILVLD